MKTGEELVEIWCEFSKTGQTMREFPAYLHEVHGEALSLRKFLELTRDSGEEFLRAKFDIGLAYVNRGLMGLAKSMLAPGVKTTNAQANIAKTLMVEMAGWGKDRDDLDSTTNNMGEPFQLRMESGGKILGFLTHIGAIIPVEITKEQKVAQETREKAGGKSDHTQLFLSAPNPHITRIDPGIDFRD